MTRKEAFQGMLDGEIESFTTDEENLHIDYLNYVVREVVYTKPATEEVEVKRWAVITKEGSFRESSRHDIKPDDTYMNENWPGCLLIELTGHYTREVPRKVKRREEFEMPENIINELFYKTPLRGKNVKFFIEIEE